MAMKRSEQFCLRFSMDNPRHVKVYQILENLNLKIYKSKTQFIINAIEAYIEEKDEETLTRKKKKRKDEFMTREQFQQEREQMKSEIRTELYQELISYLANSAMSGAIRQMPVNNQQITKEEPRQQEVITHDDKVKQLGEIDSVMSEAMKWS